MQNELNKLNLTLIKRWQYILLAYIYSTEGKVPEYTDLKIEVETVNQKGIKKKWGSRKILKYVIFPFVLVYIIMDEILIRLKEEE